MSTAEPHASSSSSRPPWVSFVLGAAIVAAVVGLFLLLRGGDDDPGSVVATGTTAARARPVAVSPERLTALAQERNRPIYWVGPARGQTYELTETPDGSLYLRYLDAGSGIGDPRPNFLTVGTYPQASAFKTVTQASKRPGAQVEKLEDEGVASASRSRPNSWYIAYPDSEELVEVFSPRPGRARELVRAGRVVPVAD